MPYITAAVSDANASFIAEVASKGIPALLSLPEPPTVVLNTFKEDLRNLLRNKKLSIREFSKPDGSYTAKTIALDKLLTMIDQPAKAKNGLQLVDFPNLADFKPIEKADVKVVLPTTFKLFWDTIIDKDKIDILPLLQPQAPHMIQAYINAGYSSTMLHFDHAMARNMIVGGVGDPNDVWAVWTIFPSTALESLIRFVKKKGGDIGEGFFLTEAHLSELREKQITFYTIEQKYGQSVIVPIGCLHQVINQANCSAIKIAYDFLPPGSASRMKEFNVLLEKTLPNDFKRIRPLKLFDPDLAVQCALMHFVSVGSNLQQNNSAIISPLSILAPSISSSIAKKRNGSTTTTPVSKKAKQTAPLVIDLSQDSDTSDNVSKYNLSKHTKRIASSAATIPSPTNPIDLETYTQILQEHVDRDLHQLPDVDSNMTPRFMGLRLIELHNARYQEMETDLKTKVI